MQKPQAGKTNRPGEDSELSDNQKQKVAHAVALVLSGTLCWRATTLNGYL